MRISNVIKEIEERFKQFDIGVYEAKLLISRYFDVSIGMLYTIDISESDYKNIMSIVSRRINREPLDIIFGKTCFYGRDFIVTSDVLSPRLDSEVLIDVCKDFIKSGDKVLDLCSGSGALGITIKLETDTDVTLSDISAKTLKVASDNANLYGVDVCYVQGDLFENILDKYNVIISNPPYIRTSVVNKLDEEVKRFDPILALDGGVDGLDFYNRIIQEAKVYLEDGGYLIFEIGYDQAQSVSDILIEYNYKVLKVVKDYGGNDRVIVAKFGSKIV